MAVIDVPIDMADVERLDRFAVGMMPAVDSDAMRFFRQAIREDHVLFDTGDELSERLVSAIDFDELVVLVKRGRCFAVFGEWLGLERRSAQRKISSEILAVMSEAVAASAMAWAVFGVMGMREKSASLPTARWSGMTKYLAECLFPYETVPSASMVLSDRRKSGMLPPKDLLEDGRFAIFAPEVLDDASQLRAGRAIGGRGGSLTVGAGMCGFVAHSPSPGPCTVEGEGVTGSTRGVPSALSVGRSF